MTTYCEADVRCLGMNFPRYRPCQNRAKVVRDGKSYCGVHAPQRVKPKSGRKRVYSEKYKLLMHVSHLLTKAAKRARRTSETG